MEKVNSRVEISSLNDYLEKEVEVCGWVRVVRNQGKMIFLVLSDISGEIQVVVLSNSTAKVTVKSIREEYVVCIKGIVRKRPVKNYSNQPTNGDLELEALDIRILNTCITLPFPVNSNTRQIDEHLRLKFRYLDLRSKRMRKNVLNRSRVQAFVRTFLEKEKFIEIETPLLSAHTPEGARSFVIPSRKQKGNFYSLPQSPQQYKQLLMISGFERYFQFARCMRDEDSRVDRQPEFTQLDMELSFVSRDDVMRINEELLIELVHELYPDKHIQEIPFPRMTYKEAMARYGNDRPDIRVDRSNNDLLAFLWVVDFPMFERTDSDNVDNLGKWTFTHNPFSKPNDDSLDLLKEKKRVEEIISTQYDITLNGFEVGGGSIRNHSSELQANVFEIMGYSKQRITNDFGHILEALNYGAPPHGGIAWGFDRLMMILENERSLREVIPFPKNGEGKDVLMGAPSNIANSLKNDLGIH